MASDSEYEEEYNKEYEEEQEQELLKWLCLNLDTFDLTFQGYRNYTEDYVTIMPTINKILEELIPKHYNKARIKLKKTLGSVLHVAITIEAWKWKVTNRIRGRNIWTATVHFVHRGELVSQTLFTVEAKARTAKNMADVLRKILTNEWEILHKVVCFVTSYEKNEKPIRNAIIDFLKIPHIYCAASTLNLDMQEALIYLNFAEIKKRYPKERVIFKRRGKQDEPIFWHIPYIMLKEIGENNVGDFNADERKEISECVQILKPFEDLSNKLSSEQYLTLSHIIPLIVGVKLKINECSPSTKLGRQFQKKLLVATNLNFGNDVTKHIKVAEKATFMDPRFKKAGFMTEEQANSVQQDVMMEWHECFNSRDQQDPETPTSNNLSEETATAVDNENILLYLDERVKYMTDNDTSLCTRFNVEKDVSLPVIYFDTRTRTHCTRTHCTRFNVEQYIDMPYIHRSDNPYQFWDYCNVFTTNHSGLYNMSQKYLCIPATAIPVELISNNFNDIRKRTVPDIMFLNLTNCKNLLFLERTNEVLFLHSYYLNKNNYI